MSLRRPLVRLLAAESGRVTCPRNGRIAAAACGDCPYMCRDEGVPQTVACAYPIPAADTFMTRRRGREDVKIALEQTLERT